MYKYIDYENLKGVLVAEENGVLLRALQKCIVFYTRESLLRVSVGSCLEYRGLQKITDTEKQTILGLTEKYFPGLKAKVEAALARTRKPHGARVTKNAPIFQLLQGVTLEELLAQQPQAEPQAEAEVKVEVE